MRQDLLRQPVPDELEVLLTLLGKHLSPLAIDADEGLHSIVRQFEGWAKLVDLANRHRVLPLLYQGLKERCWPDVPAEIRQSIQRLFVENLKRNLRLAHHGTNLVNALSASGIRVIPFKGVFLAQSAYGHLSSRQVNDIDLLIGPKDRMIAGNILGSLGYCSVEKLDQQEVFRNPGAQIEVDLHWDITPALFPVSFDFERVFGRTKRRDLAGTAYDGLSLRDQLLLLSVQLAKDCWERQQKVIHLQKLCDLLRVITAMSDSDFERVMTDAEERGLRGVVHFSLILVSGLLGLRLPGDLQQRLGADTRALRVAREAASLPELARTELPPERNALLDIGVRWRQLRFYMGLRESWRHRGAYVAGIFRAIGAGGARKRRGRAVNAELKAAWSGQLLTAAALDGTESAIHSWELWQTNFGLDSVDSEAYWVLPAVHASLSKQGCTGPDYGRLAGICKQMRIRNAELQSRLAAVLESFRVKHCAVLVGPPSSLVLQGHKSDVPLKPVLLIVHSGNAGLADRLLRSAGWHSDRTVPDADLRAFIASIKYAHPASGEIELCWRPLGTGAPSVGDAALWESRDSVAVAETTVDVPCPVDQALIIALRGSRIKTTMINQWLDITWRRIHERARELGLDPDAVRLGHGAEADEYAPPMTLLRRHRKRYVSCASHRRPAYFLHYLRDYYSWSWQSAGFMNGLFRALRRRVLDQSGA